MPTIPAANDMESGGKTEPEPIPTPVNSDTNVEMVDLTLEEDVEEERARKKPRMDDESQESDFIQDCIDANFVEDEDDEDSGKLWCRMCRSVHLYNVILPCRTLDTNCFAFGIL